MRLGFGWGWVLKILLRLNCSSPCSGLTTCNGGSWWSPVVVEEEVGGFQWRFGGEKGRKYVFYSVGCICSLQDSPRQNFGRMGELAQARLAWASSGWIHLQHILLLLCNGHISCYICYFANPNGQNMKIWVASLQSKFEGDPTVNKSKIMVLTKQVLGQPHNHTVPT